MGQLSKRYVMGAIALCSLSGLTGCQLSNLKGFGFSNPFLPQARFYLGPVTNTGTSGTTSAAAPSEGVTISVSTASAPTVQWQLNLYPGDNTPGITLTQYTVDYLDSTGQPISPNLIARQTLGMDFHIPATHGYVAGNTGVGASGTTGSTGTTGTTGTSGTTGTTGTPGAPGTTGSANGASFQGPLLTFGGPDLTAYGKQELLQGGTPYITGILTVMGVDDDGYSDVASMSFPITFTN